MARYLLFGSLFAICMVSGASAQEGPFPVSGGAAMPLPSDGLPAPTVQSQPVAAAVIGTPPTVAQLLAAPALPELDIKLAQVWAGNMDLDLQGADGNDIFNLNYDGHVKRKTDDDLLTAALSCRKDSDGLLEITNQGVQDVRYQWMAKTSRLTWFVQETAGYNEFEPYDLRMKTDGGLGLRFIENDSTKLLGRFGGRSEYECGIAGDLWKPEVIAGMEMEHKLNKFLKLSTSAEYTPTMADAADRRMRGKGTLGVELGPSLHLPLKLIATDDYDSAASPNGRSNNLGYSALIGWNY